MQATVFAAPLRAFYGSRVAGCVAIDLSEWPRCRAALSIRHILRKPMPSAYSLGTWTPPTESPAVPATHLVDGALLEAPLDLAAQPRPRARRVHQRRRAVGARLLVRHLW